VSLNLNNVAHDKNISDENLINAYASIVKALRTRGIIRTKNVVGDLGERYAETYYQSNDVLPDIVLAQANSKDIDAKEKNGDTYSIKAASLPAKRTSAFHLDKEHLKVHKSFDFLIVVLLNENMELDSLYEFSWHQFWKNKSWSKPQKAWFLSLTKRNLSIGRKLYPQDVT
jgi:Family of unknown function (DUF6998)